MFLLVTMIACARRVSVPLWLAATRLRHRPERVVLVLLGIAAAAAALAAMQAGTLVAQDRSVAERVASLPAETRAIRLASFSVAGQSDPYRVVDGRARRALTPLLDREPIATVLYRETTIAGAYVGLGAVDGLARWIELESGRLPRRCTPARCEVVELRGGGRLPNAPGLRLVRASTQLLVLTPIRLGLGLAGLGAAVLAGRAGPALLAFAAGTLGATITLSADPRYSRDRLSDVAPLPPEPHYASKAEIARAGIFPSTFGVTVLTAIAVFFDATLAALLAGVLAGMAASGFIAWLNLDTIERRQSYRLYVERPGERVFAGPR